ncbi:MAG TPA: class I SAM-dependent methyltransferase [Roseimicrobium sp.]|nr:class I SAM-dependent methyltransferase [Roseimicrobium sp.]
MSSLDYVGDELGLFALATHWKGYWVSQLKPYLGSEVLEVGAGIGTNTPYLRTGKEKRWVCLEPDPKLAAVHSERLRPVPEVIVGTLEDLPADAHFDTILYIDVLEHIENDHGELARAADRLLPGGRLIVLSPAHQWLFSPFDGAIGHFRRYDRKQMLALTPGGLVVEKCFYLDSVGLLASAANRLLLQQSMPDERQIRIWDRYMVPCSRVIDPLICRSIGKTVVAIWRRPTDG